MRLSYFNSIKVRLEHLAKMKDSAFKEFQFHKGAIRTIFALVARFEKLAFQFHKGAIRTRRAYRYIELNAVFQFHKGAIRTLTNSAKRGEEFLNFNSIKVRLELTLVMAAMQLSSEFQFHKGAIRTSVFHLNYKLGN